MAHAFPERLGTAWKLADELCLAVEFFVQYCYMRYHSELLVGKKAPQSVHVHTKPACVHTDCIFLCHVRCTVLCVPHVCLLNVSVMIWVHIYMDIHVNVDALWILNTRVPKWMMLPYAICSTYCCYLPMWPLHCQWRNYPYQSDAKHSTSLYPYIAL